MKSEVLKFISKFKDSNYLDGNCYWFAILLKERFKGDIYYDIYVGHFITRIDDQYYDYSGVYKTTYLLNPKIIVRWEDFKNFDELQYNRIIRDCCT